MARSKRIKFQTIPYGFGVYALRYKRGFWGRWIYYKKNYRGNIYMFKTMEEIKKVCEELENE